MWGLLPACFGEEGCQELPALREAKKRCRLTGNRWRKEAKLEGEGWDGAGADPGVIGWGGESQPGSLPHGYSLRKGSTGRFFAIGTLGRKPELATWAVEYTGSRKMCTSGNEKSSLQGAVFLKRRIERFRNRRFFAKLAGLAGGLTKRCAGVAVIRLPVAKEAIFFWNFEICSAILQVRTGPGSVR
jgi:hypothetical protein